MTNFSATTEQVRAMDLFQTGESLKINAFAGSGKTATLKFLADNSQKAGLYLAFNKSLAEEAESKFPYWVSCKTCHSIAYRSMRRSFTASNEKMFGVLNTYRVANLFSFRQTKEDLSPRSRACLIIETLRKFMQSDDAEIETKHVPEWGNLKTQEPKSIERTKKDVVEHANKLWEKMIDPDDNSAPLGHDGYFKLWALSNPTLPVEFILLDEAQDTAPVMLGVLKKQKCQVVLVGDKYQQIYEWRGAVNAMELFETQQETTLTQSFRFGETIAEAATKLLSSLGEDKTLKGNPAISSKLGCSNPEVILCRTNATVIDYALRCLNSGAIPHILGGNSELVKMLTAVSRLKAGEGTDVPEFFGFTNWSEVIAFSKMEEGASLKTLVRIVERYGERKLLDALNKTNSSELGSDLIISTIHRAKGRQWDRVVIIDDFGSENTDSRTEKQLIYVALTRAREEVQIPYSVTSMLGIKQEIRAMQLNTAQ